MIEAHGPHDKSRCGKCRTAWTQDSISTDIIIRGVRYCYITSRGVKSTYTASRGVKGTYTASRGVKGTYTASRGVKGTYTASRGVKGTYTGILYYMHALLINLLYTQDCLLW